MANMKPATRQRTFIGRLDHNGDLIEEITTFCRDNHITLATVSAIGAVRKSRLAYYNQKTQKYEFYNLDQPMEILHLTGNISLRNGEPIVHAHVTLSDDKGNTFGGHLSPGTIIFSCECIIQEFDGPKLVRSVDEPTGLPLWEMT